MRPADAAGSRQAWAILERLWAPTVARARQMPADLHHERVDEEWSFIETLRPRQVAACQHPRFFDGLDLVPPGLVYVHAWRPDPGDVAPGGGVSAHGGVARKS